MNMNELMDDFAAGAGIEDLVPDADGVYHLLIDGMSMSVRAAGDGHLAMLAEVGEPPPDAVAGRERLYRTLLESAHLGQGTAGAAFSIDAETGSIWLCRQESTAALDQEGFKRLLGGFVDALAEWRRIVADFRPVAGQVDAEALENEKATRLMGMGADGFMQV